MSKNLLFTKFKRFLRSLCSWFSSRWISISSKLYFNMVYVCWDVGVFVKVKVSLYVWLFVYFLCVYRLFAVCSFFVNFLLTLINVWSGIKWHRKHSVNIVIVEIKATLRNVRKSWKQLVQTNTIYESELAMNDNSVILSKTKKEERMTKTTREKSKHCTKMAKKVKPFYSLDE